MSDAPNAAPNAAPDDAPPARVFIERNPGGCSCGPDCEFPCWQRLGIANPCVDCGCDVAAKLEPAA